MCLLPYSETRPGKTTQNGVKRFSLYFKSNPFSDSMLCFLQSLLKFSKNQENFYLNFLVLLECKQNLFKLLAIVFIYCQYVNLQLWRKMNLLTCAFRRFCTNPGTNIIANEPRKLLLSNI